MVLAFGPTNATRGLVKSYEKLARDLSARFLSVDALDPATGQVDTVSGLVGAYTYSDMTGFALSSAGVPSG